MEADNMEGKLAFPLARDNHDTEPEVLIIESAAVDQRAEWGEWAKEQSQILLETGVWKAFRFGPVLRLRHVCFCN